MAEDGEIIHVNYRVKWINFISTLSRQTGRLHQLVCRRLRDHDKPSSCLRVLVQSLRHKWSFLTSDLWHVRPLFRKPHSQDLHCLYKFGGSISWCITNPKNVYIYLAGQLGANIDQYSDYWWYLTHACCQNRTDRSYGVLRLSVSQRYWNRFFHSINFQILTNFKEECYFFIPTFSSTVLLPRTWIRQYIFLEIEIF